MCFAAKSPGSACQAESWHVSSCHHATLQHRRRPPDKLTMSAVLGHAGQFALMVLVVAILGHQAKIKTTTTSEDVSPEVRTAAAAAAELSSDQYAITFAALLAFFVGSAFTASILIGEPSVERLERWFGNFFSSTKSAVSNVSSSAAMTRICSTVNASSMRLFCHNSKSSDSQGRTLTISGPREPFLPLDDIAVLSLADVKDLFRYAAGMNGLQHSYLFMALGGSSSFRLSVQEAANAMEKVVSLSRGIHSSVSSFLEGCDSSSTSANQKCSFADMDALAFVAICRLFAEWRSLRLVPEGNPGYAMGMTLARRDLLQNVKKMETAVHRFLAHSPQQQNEHSKPPATRDELHKNSPTLRQMLEFEINQGVHKQLPRVNDKSGASGFLWTIRQLRYQVNILANVVQVPLVFPNTKAAANAAYHAVYDAYHGFFTRNFFTASFDAAPHADAIFSHMMMVTTLMNPPPSVAGSDDTSDETLTQPSSIDDDDTWVQLPLDDSPNGIMENQNDYSNNNSNHSNVETEREEWHEARQEHEHPLEQLGGLLVREWLKLHRFMAQCTGRDAQRHSSRNVMDISAAALRTGKQQEHHEAARTQVQSFLTFMQPFLDDMDTMMRDLNLNDPSRV